jgi:hypothetical protein
MPDPGVAHERDAHLATGPARGDPSQPG